MTKAMYYLIRPITYIPAPPSQNYPDAPLAIAHANVHTEGRTYRQEHMVYNYCYVASVFSLLFIMIVSLQNGKDYNGF